MFKINLLSIEEIKGWGTSNLATEFKETVKKEKVFSEYLCSDEVRNCDAINTLARIEETREESRLNDINLSRIKEEIISRINNYGKEVILYNEEGIAKNAYVIPKKDADDNVGFIICNNNNPCDIHMSEFKMYTKENLSGYKIDRKSDGSINWRESSKVYDEVFDFRDDDSRVVKYKDKYGLINEEGKELIPPKYDGISFNASSFEKVKLGDKWAVMNKKGELLTDFEYDEINLIPGIWGSDNDPIIVRVDKKYGVIDKDKNIIVPIQCDYIKRFCHYNLLEINVESKEMLYDFSGESILPLKEYDRITPLAEDLIQARVNHKSGIYTIKGEEIAPPIYIWIEEFNKEGLAHFCRDKEPGEIGESGKPIKQRGYIDKTGREVKLA